jgi:hypothetical protein
MEQQSNQKGSVMIKKIMRQLSFFAWALLIGGVVVTTDVEQVIATGTNIVQVMSLGVSNVTETFFSPEIAGNLASAVMIVAGIYIVMTHGGVALVPALVLFLGAGLIIQGREVIQEAGYTAVGL